MSAPARDIVRASLFLDAEPGERVALDGGVAYLRNGARLGFDQPFVCVIGAFDGLHEGHRAIIAAARADADSRGVPLAVVTFDPDPSEVLSSEPPMRLVPDDVRVRALSTTAADAVIAFDFTADLARVPYRAFVGHLASVIRPVSVHVGTDFRFGTGGEGTVERIAELGRVLGFETHGHDLVLDAGVPVTSTRIRGLLKEGKVRDAARLLGRAHFLSGTVEHGRGEGTGFGIPTANVVYDPRDCAPAVGVYACYFVTGGQIWPAAVNVGAPATFVSEEMPLLEANIIGFDQDIYGAEAAVVFMELLRGERHFSSIAELRETVLGNIAWTREHLGPGCLGGVA